jgi:Uma2 family endonuclease
MSTTAVDAGWLDWLAEEAGAKVEVDAEGSIVVSPASDAHVFAANQLQRLLLTARPAELLVLLEGPRWTPRGSVGPSYVPDLCILERRALPRPAATFALDPAPLLIVEITSPESRRRDLGEKADAYYAGGALSYWTIELPAVTNVDRPAATIRERGPDRWDTRGPLVGVVETATPLAIRIDLDNLAI